MAYRFSRMRPGAATCISPRNSILETSFRDGNV
jgi:hypothetical protein